MRLRRNEFCPIHKSLSCCGREFIPKARTIRLGVQRIEDPHHPMRIPGTAFTGRDAEAAEPEDCRAGQEVCNLPRRVHGLQRCCARPSGSEGDGRRLEG